MTTYKVSVGYDEKDVFIKAEQASVEEDRLVLSTGGIVKAVFAKDCWRFAVRVEPEVIG